MSALAGNGAEAVLVLEGVSKRFVDGRREVRALEDVSLVVGRGETLAITGPSGSGKSTLLHLMGGLDAPTRGAIAIEGRALARMSDRDLARLRRRRLGFVFQSFHLLPALTAEENVALPLLLDGQAPRAALARARRLLALVGLAERGAHRPATLSGGEMQRVAVARALVAEPALVLADEPTGNLDAASAAIVLALLVDLGRRLGQTTVLVTHDARAAACTERVITLSGGRLARCGPGGTPVRARGAPVPTTDGTAPACRGLRARGP